MFSIVWLYFGGVIYSLEVSLEKGDFNTFERFIVNMVHTISYFGGVK